MVDSHNPPVAGSGEAAVAGEERVWRAGKLEPMPTPSASRNTVGPRIWIDGGASGSFRMGSGSSPPACQTFSAVAERGCFSGTPEVELSTSKAKPP